MIQQRYKRSGKLWFVSDGFIWDSLGEGFRRPNGGPLECSSKLFIYNPHKRAARVKAVFYHSDREPTSVSFSVRGGRIHEADLATLPEIPHNRSFWIAIESNLPVLPQARHEDYNFWDPVPDAIGAVAPYPGPLGSETSWVIPDCYQGSSRSWYERETVSILNPGAKAVKARVRYLLRGRDLGAWEDIEIPARRLAQLDVWERRPMLLGTTNGPAVRVEGDYAMRIDATGPVIAQATRRARNHGVSSVRGSRSSIAIPLSGQGVKTWYYPAGLVADQGILPRATKDQHPLSQCDNTWDLLFVNNLDEKRPVDARIIFHYQNGRKAVSERLPIKPTKSILNWLHGDPWLGSYTRVGEPFAMTVTAPRPIACEVTCAEFEMWSDVNPGAMSSANLYPGPLAGEKSWWLGVGHAGGRDTVATEWRQAWHIFNPGTKPAHLTLSFVGAARTITHTLEVPAGAVRMVDGRDVKGLPFAKPFAVRAEGDRAFCPAVWARSLTRGLPHTRGMYVFVGVPMKLNV